MNTVTKVLKKNEPEMWAEKNDRAIKFFTARPNGILRGKRWQRHLFPLKIPVGARWGAIEAGNSLRRIS